ncbi:MBL fold metallo-hydrolase [Pseudonocardia ailaonensis]|uniref:MBL fold metallo-hydrolase n=1 Tax=Pseudonocardia ailaonensis TaxID=367279 RepID=A0ABN2N999_9PSEU
MVAPTVTQEDPSLSGGDWTAPGVYRCAPDVYRIPLPLPSDGLRAVNVYAIADGSADDPGWTLVDAGWALQESRELLADAMAALGVGLAGIRRFLVTHSHRDHYTQAVTVRREFGAEILIGAGEEPNLALVSDPEYVSHSYDLSRLQRAGAAHIASTVADWSVDHDSGQWEMPDGWLADGTRLGVGSGRTLEVVETPGHTRGHVVYADDGNGLLFAGDHVLPTITPSIGFEPLPLESPLAAFLTSLRLLLERPDAELLPAHGVVGRRVHERVDELLAHHGERLDASLAAVREGRHTAFEVAGALGWTRRLRRLDELDLQNTMLAVNETLAHLDVLVERGALTRTDVDGITRYDLS